MNSPVTPQVTILITTFNRYPYLFRLLNYYQSAPEACSIVVLDSSSDELTREQENYLQSQKQVIRLRFPSEIFVPEKIARGFEHVQTPFSVLCADDDFITIHGLRQAIQFLENHHDYSCAMGRSISHFWNTDHHRFEWSPLFYLQPSIEDEWPLDRLNRCALGQGIMTMYAVYRTSTHRAIWTDTSKYVSDWGLSELFPCLLSHLYGKVKILPVFFWSYEKNIRGWTDEDYQRQMYSRKNISTAAEGFGKHLHHLLMIKPEQAFQLSMSLIQNCITVTQKKPGPTTVSPFIRSWRMYKKIKTYVWYRFYRFLYHWMLVNPVATDSIDFSKIKQLVASEKLPQSLLERTRKTYMKR